MAKFNVGDRVRIKKGLSIHNETEVALIKLAGKEGRIEEQQTRKEYNWLASDECSHCGSDIVNQLDIARDIGAVCCCALEKPLPDSDSYDKSTWEDYHKAINAPHKAPEPEEVA